MLKYAFLLIFAGGLGLGVYSMLHGVERSNRNRPRPSAIFNAPSLAMFAVFFGGAGYLLFTRTELRLAWTVLIAAVIAVAATTIAAAIIARWAFPYYGTTSEEEMTQGTLALVTRTISPQQPGEIELLRDGIREILTAESISGFEIPRNTEVVIETIHEGVARVEPWSAVEGRL